MISRVFLILFSCLSISGLAIAEDVAKATEKPLPTPSDQQIQRALQLGNLFQEMASQQNRPRTGAPFPLSYIYRPNDYPYHFSAWPYSPHQNSRYVLRFSPHRAPIYPRLRPFYVRPPHGHNFKHNQPHD